MNFHLTIAVLGRSVMARDEAERRVMVRTIARVGADRLMAFSLVDDHLHAALRGEHGGRIANAIRAAIASLRSDEGFELGKPWLQEVKTRAHLSNLLRYILDQPAHHGIGAASPLWTGSCFQDLIGVRLLPGFDPRSVLAELPRLCQRELFEAVGLEATALEPADDEALARAGVARLVELAAGVHAAAPGLTTRAAEVVQTRLLATRVAHQVGLPIATIARFLGVGVRNVQRFTHREVDPRAVKALRRRLALEDRVARLAIVRTIGA